MDYYLYCDGASRGNPGFASIGVLLCNEKGSKRVAEISKSIGTATNNVAEYSALIEGVKRAAGFVKEGDRLTIRMDSELVVKQIQGVYKVKHPNLKLLHESAKSALDTLPSSWKIEHIPREKNKDADALANAALDNL